MKIAGDPAADVSSFIRQGENLQVRIHKAHLVPGDGIDFQCIPFVSDLDRLLGAPVALQRVTQGNSLRIRNALRIQVYPITVVDGLPVKDIQKGIHGILHAQAAHEQNHAADNAEEGHEASGFMAEAVPQVPFCAEGERLEAFGFLDPQVFDPFGHIRPQGIRSGALQHFPHGEEADDR